MPISDEELRRRTLVASGRYDELARLLQSVKLRKLLVSLSKAGVEDATLDSTGLATLNEFDISAKSPGERILLLEALRARLANCGNDGRKRGTVITACKGYFFVRADGQPKKKGKDGYYCSFKDVEGRKTLARGDRVAFEVVAVEGSKHTHKLQNVVVLARDDGSDDGVFGQLLPRKRGGQPRLRDHLGRLGLAHLAPLLAREQIDEEVLPLLSVEDLIEAGVPEADARRVVLTAAAPPSPPDGEHERTLAEAKGAVLRLMEENKRLRDASAGAESSSALVKENRRLRQELDQLKTSRAEEIAAAAAKAYTSEKAANRCALEGLELMKRERENAVRALAEETAAHAETKRELHDRDEKARTRAMFFATELEDAVRGLAEERQAHQATRQQLTPFLSGAYQGEVEKQLVEWRGAAQDALKELAMERDVHVRTKSALNAEQAAHAATRDRTVMRVVESKHALKAEQAAHAATRAELSATQGALERMANDAARAGAFKITEKSKTEPTAEPTAEPPTEQPTAEPTSEPETTRVD
jgi:hypothetical protein